MTRKDTALILHFFFLICVGVIKGAFTISYIKIDFLHYFCRDILQSLIMQRFLIKLCISYKYNNYVDNPKCQTILLTNVTAFLTIKNVTF